MSAEETFRLFDQLDEGGFSTAILTSYNVYFPFFEQVVVRRLHAAGCAQVILFADARMCAQAFADEELRPTQAGRSYVLIPVRMGGAFHPKMLLQLGRKQGALCVGSHNLTLSGFGLNDEITNVIRYAARGKGRPSSVFAEAIHFLRQFIPRLPGFEEGFQGAIEVAPWLSEKPDPREEARLFGSTTNGPSLWSALLPELPRNPKRALVVGPFFDRELGFLGALLRQLSPAQTTVAIEPSSAQIAPDALASVPAVKFVNGTGCARIPGRRDGASPYLHAKLLWFETEQGEVLVSGSANPSAAAFLADTAHRNAEAVVLRRETGLAAALGLDAFLGAPEISEEDWSEMAERQQAASLEQQPDQETLRILLATPDDHGFRVAGRLPLHSPVQAHRGASTAGTGKVVLEGDVSEVRGAELEPERTSHLTANDGASRCWIVVNQPDLLAPQGNSDTRQALQKALGTLDEDPTQLEVLLKLTEKVLFESDDHVRATMASTGTAERAQEGETGGQEPSPGANSPSLAVEARGPRAALRRRSIARGDITLLLDALIHRLGEGLPQQTTGAGASFRQAESPAEDENDPPPTPPDLKTLAAACRRRIKALCRRMTGQLGKFDKNPEGNARRLVLQVATVFGILRALEGAQRREEWRRQELELLDQEAMDDLWVEVLWRVGNPETQLFHRALEENDGEPFEELSMAVGLLSWAAWVLGLDPVQERETPSPRSEDSEPWYPLQLLALLAPFLVEDQAANKLLEQAVIRSSRRGVDAFRWLSRIRKWFENVTLALAYPDDVSVIQRRACAGDLVILSTRFSPRVRVLMHPEPGEKGIKLRLANLAKPGDWETFLAGFVKVTDPFEGVP